MGLPARVHTMKAGDESWQVGTGLAPRLTNSAVV